MNTTALPERISPLHDELVHLSPRWGELHGMPVAVSIATPEIERSRVETLGLTDLSALPRITLKGPGAITFLKELGVAIPDIMFGVAPQTPGGAIIARTGGSEFFIEDDFNSSAVAKIIDAVGPLGGGRPGVYPMLRADASILITGRLATELFAQTCAVDMRTATADKLIFTRVAGVSCSILQRNLSNVQAFQLWLDGTYGLSLWESLAEIAGELGGGPVGLLSVFPSVERSVKR